MNTKRARAGNRGIREFKAGCPAEISTRVEYRSRGEYDSLRFGWLPTLLTMTLHDRSVHLFEPFFLKHRMANHSKYSMNLKQSCNHPPLRSSKSSCAQEVKAALGNGSKKGISSGLSKGRRQQNEEAHE